MCLYVEDAMVQRQIFGADFEDFLDKHSKLSGNNPKKAMLMTSRFMIKQLQLMHRVSLMQLQVHKLLEGGARSRKKRKELK